MTTRVPPGVEADKVARAALELLSTAFNTRDVDSLMDQFSPDPASTYAGSEAGEIATGRRELVELLSALLGRPERYRFEFDDVRAQASESTIWVLADGHGYECDPHGRQDRFPYRVVGILAADPDGWRWLLLSGSEPTTPEVDTASAAG